MSHFLHSLRSRTFEKGFIWKASIGIILLGVLVSALLSSVFGVRKSQIELLRSGSSHSDQGTYSFFPGNGDKRGADAALAFIRDEKTTFEDLIGHSDLIAGYYAGPQSNAIDQAIRNRFDSESGELFLNYISVFALKNKAAEGRLKAKAEARPLIRYANRLAGELELKKGNRSPAYKHFVTEGKLEEANVSRELAISLLVEAEAIEQLAELLEDPLYHEFLDTRTRLEIAQHKHDWLGVALGIPEMMIEEINSQFVPLALFAAIVWGLILARLGQLKWGINRVSFLCLFGFMAGIVSIWPTYFFIYLENEFVGYSPDGDMLGTIAFYVGGVGLREEVCKLLLFLPFAPLLMKRRSELDALLVASFVGLGFAAEENVSYFANTMGIAAPARLLTANFFHVSLTGLSGVALIRVFSGGSFNDFLYRFGIVVVAHGLYDALLSIPSLGDGGFLAMIVLILISMFYFREYDAYRYGEKGGFSLTSILAFGLCGLISLVLIALSLQVGLSSAITIVATEALGVAIIVVMFVREFNEPLR